LIFIQSGCIPPGSEGTRSNGAGGADSLQSEDDITRVRWVRIHGAGDESTPPVLQIPVKGNAVEGASKIGSQALTMSFDMESPTLPNVTLILVHCDRDWRPTENIFVQDIMHLRTSDFTIERAPIGVHGYDYSLSITFPRVDGVLKIEYSGNYRARVVDYYDNTKVYTEARFIAVEPKSDVDVGVYQDFYESTQTDVVQHGLRVRAEAVTPNDLFSTQIKAIQLYRSGEWLEPMTASQDNARRNFGPGQVWTDWSGYIGTRTVA
jgi:hypothetical protein